MIVISSKVTGTIASEDNDLIMGTFIVTEIEDDIVFMRCLSHEMDEDNVGEDFEADIDDVELLNPNQSVVVSQMLVNNDSKRFKVGSGNLTETEMIVLGII